MSTGADPVSDLSTLIRTELHDTDPQGFLFNDHVIRQDVALERLVERLRGDDSPAVAALAVGRAVDEETDGWTLLKLLELCERLALTGSAPALMRLVERRHGSDDERSRFLAGRASEVLLRLPLDLETRNRANDITKAPLEEINRFRMSTQRARQIHRPRRIEWALLVTLMLIGLLGLIFALRATG